MKNIDKKTVGYTESSNFRCLEDQQWVNTMSTINPLNLDYCGIEQCEPEDRFGPYVRENYVVHIILNGCGTLRVGEKSFKISRGGIFLICPGQETVYQADAENPWQYMWLGFHGYMAKKAVHFMGFTEECPVIYVEKLDLLRKELEKILEAKELAFVNMMKRLSAFFSMISMMIEENPKCWEVKKPSSISYVNKAVEIIMQSYSKKLKISDIATTIGISRNYLTELFKKELEMSPQSFLMNIRMEKAAQELVETNESVQNIGINVGYPDPLAFSKSFKQKYGMSPSVYRASAAELVQRSAKGEYTTWHPL